MYLFLSFVLIALTVSAQTPPPHQPSSQPPQSSSQVLDKPPQDVDDALRARIKQFYDYHVAAVQTGNLSEYRHAEQLIAEESKDDFYALSKPEIHSYKVGNIEYSENFTKAKAVIVGAMPVLLAWAGGKIMDMPFASYWKIENGQWYWYYNKEAFKHTPFGDVKTPPNSHGAMASALPVMPTAETLIANLQSALKIDRTHVELSAGKPETVKVTNTLPGPASLSIASPFKSLGETGITATFDKQELKGNETAILTLTAGPKARAGNVPLRITISPTNQVLDLTVTVTSH